MARYRKCLDRKWIEYSFFIRNITPQHVLDQSELMSALVSALPNPDWEEQDCEEALRIVIEDGLARSLLEARLLNQQPVEAIAARMNIPVKAIQVYYYLFYNLDEYQGESRVALRYAAFPTSIYDKPATKDLDDQLKRFAFMLPIDGFESLVTYWQMPSPSLKRDWAQLSQEEASQLLEWIDHRIIWLIGTLDPKTVREKLRYEEAVLKLSYSFPGAELCVEVLQEVISIRKTELESESTPEPDPEKPSKSNSKKRSRKAKPTKSEIDPDLEEFITIVDSYAELQKVLTLFPESKIITNLSNGIHEP
jgi:hypothetical protein